MQGQHGNEILENVKGLTEIEDAKKHLDILAEKLY